MEDCRLHLSVFLSLFVALFLPHWLAPLSSLSLVLQYHMEQFFLCNLLNLTVNDTVMKITIAIIGIDIRDSSPALEVDSRADNTCTS